MKNPLASKKINLLSILCDTTFAAACGFAVFCTFVIFHLPHFYPNTALQLTPNTSFFPDWVVRFFGLFSDMVFESRGTSYILTTYVKTEMICSLIISVFAAVAIFFASRPVHRMAFGEQLFAKKSVRALNIAAIALLLMAVVPAVVESIIIANGNNLHGMYTVNGAVLAVIVMFAAMLVKCGLDLLPQDETAVENEDDKASKKAKSSAVAKLGQNSRALSAVLWIAIIGIVGAAVWVLISLIPILPHIASDALIEREPSSDPVLAVMLGTIQARQYTPLALAVRYTWDIAALVLAALAAVKGNKILKCTRREETALTEQTAKLFKSCAALVLACSCVGLAGGIASFFLSGVRFTVPVCGLLCASALFGCGKLITKLTELKEKREKADAESADDISDISFVLN